MTAAAVGFMTTSCVPAVCAAILLTGGRRTFARRVRAFLGRLCVVHRLIPFRSKILPQLLQFVLILFVFCHDARAWAKFITNETGGPSLSRPRSFRDAVQQQGRLSKKLWPSLRSGFALPD